MSGKLNEFISLFIGDSNAPPCGVNQGPIKAEPAAGPSGLDFFNYTLDACQHELPGGTPFTGGGFTNTAVKVAGQVEGGADRDAFHGLIVNVRLK